MTGLRFKLFLALRGLAFRLTPVCRRVRLEIATDGRHLTSLLHSLSEAGFAVHVTGAPMALRELIALRSTARLPFILGGSTRRCGTVISDLPEALQGTEPRKILLDYRYFDAELDFPRMPYFIHPGLQYSGLITQARKSPSAGRRVRIGFFGTRDAEFYTAHFHFPILDREVILRSFLARYSSVVFHPDRPPSEWEPISMVAVIDDKGGDRPTKSFLDPANYVEALRSCDFLLSPPGWCMPLSHSLIEGMACGAIPITNAAEYMAPALRDGVNCLTFHDEPSLLRQLERAIEMTDDEILALRDGVNRYYEEFLQPGVWLGRVLQMEASPSVLLVNAEEVSVGVTNQT